MPNPPSAPPFVNILVDAFTRALETAHRNDQAASLSGWPFVVEDDLTEPFRRSVSGFLQRLSEPFPDWCPMPRTDDDWRASSCADTEPPITVTDPVVKPRPEAPYDGSQRRRRYWKRVHER
jgi:hypothetical protein